jgi:hypothetical protein
MGYIQKMEGSLKIKMKSSGEWNVWLKGKFYEWLQKRNSKNNPEEKRKQDHKTEVRRWV